jgi:hypothetical protein
MEGNPIQYQIGDKEEFWVTNVDTHENFQITCVLRHITDHSYFWIQDGIYYDLLDLELLAEAFENEIYPTDREFFGSEWTPGIDNDPHLYIIYAGGLGVSLGGYYSSVDSVHPLAHEYSNGHETFVFNADNVFLSDAYTYGVLAHELQHMIHWYQDRNENTWLNEGFAELAVFINGYGVGWKDAYYAIEPDIQLTNWPPEVGMATANYGGAFLFVTYFLDRFGKDVTQALVAHQENGMDSIDEVLADYDLQDNIYGDMIDADNIFRDWVLANYLKDESVADGRYNYDNYPDSPQTFDTETFYSCPFSTQIRDVNQYGVDYYRISCKGTYTFTFEGSSVVDVVPADVHSGVYAFWSNRGDESDLTMTRMFDFSAETGPLTLEFWTWYDLEEDYDYLYLLASEDGENWEIITTPSGTDEDPSGNSYGWSYNGLSNGWIEEVVDISDYAGKQVFLRFEYVTDGAVNGEGMLIDDIAVPQVGYFSDFESDAGGWEGEGFVRIQNLLPQTYVVSLIFDRGGEMEVERVELDLDQGFSKILDLTGAEELVLVVSGTTRFTNMPAEYQFKLDPQ